MRDKDAGETGIRRYPLQILHNDASRGRLALAPRISVWQRTPRLVGRSRSRFPQPACCRSSVVEHSIGNGEVHSSILCGSTTAFLKCPNIINYLDGCCFSRIMWIFRPKRAVLARTHRERLCQLAHFWHKCSASVPMAVAAEALWPASLRSGRIRRRHSGERHRRGCWAGGDVPRPSNDVARRPRSSCLHHSPSWR